MKRSTALECPICGKHSRRKGKHFKGRKQEDIKHILARLSVEERAVIIGKVIGGALDPPSMQSTQKSDSI